MTKDQMTTRPDGCRTVTPYLVVDDVPGLLEFLGGVFGAVEIRRTTDADGVVRHARVRIGDSVVMIGPVANHQPAFPGVLYLYLDDAEQVDDAHRAALARGAETLRAPAHQPYGDYNVGVIDRFGNQWWIAAHTNPGKPAPG